MFGPEERRRAVERYSATPPATARATRPGSAWNVGLRRIPGMPVVWRNPSSHWRQGPRRSSWYWAACGGSRPPNGSARASEPSTTGSRRTQRGRHGRAATQEQERRAERRGRVRAAAKPECRGRQRRHSGAVPQDRGTGAGERVDAGGGGGSQKKTQAPICGACRTGRRRCRSTVRGRRIRPAR